MIGFCKPQEIDEAESPQRFKGHKTHCVDSMKCSARLQNLLLNMPVLPCYTLLLPSVTFHCFTLSSKPTFSENLILHLSLFLSVGLIS